MISLLSSVVFLNPWVLGALLGLPALWLLLRVTPPAPRRVTFPAARFLSGLIADDVSPSKTPWWILLLRVLALAFIIIGLAHPLTHPSQPLESKGPIRLIIENDWASAAHWDAKIREAQDLLILAERDNTDIHILTTAPERADKQPRILGPLTAPQARDFLKTIEPLPWFSDFNKAASLLSEKEKTGAITHFWLGDGLEKDGFTELAEAVRPLGPIIYSMPKHTGPAPILQAAQGFSNAPRIAALLSKDASALADISVTALSQDGRILDVQTITPKGNKTSHIVEFDIPDILRNDITRYALSGIRGVAAQYLLDDQYIKRRVGLLSDGDSADDAPLIEAGYYIQRALEPYSALSTGTIDLLLSKQPDVIIMPDIADLPAETLNTLEQWVNNGGVLIRFAGPSMTQTLTSSFLVPVPLRGGGRSLGGSLTWETPLGLAPFPENSPLYGLTIPDDITVKQQILAEPTQDLEQKTWASIEDGTPLITAAPKERGLIVFVHTTATPEWSDLSLSGLFVDILRRIVSLSGKNTIADFNAVHSLEPLSIMNGFGALMPADDAIKPINIADLETLRPSPDHPPGLYGRGGVKHALNMGDAITSLRRISPPPYIQVQDYENRFEKDYKPYALLLGLLLLIIDWIIMFFISSGYFLSKKTAFAASFMLLLLSTGTAQAQNTNFDLKYSNGLYLAYIKTGQSSVDRTSQRGLENLSRVLNRRTSAEPKGVVGVDPARDTLAFFPLIYWPISGNESPLPLETLQNVQSYLNHGGTILFDTRDQNSSAQRLGGSNNSNVLRTMIEGLNIPPLMPIPGDHVLGKSFYLLDSFPGLYSGGTLWVEENSKSGRDGVSSILIGSHDWAAGWANADTRSLRPSSRQQEHALRFGVNIIMYALTGNYKADQVHVPHILKRLGQ